MARTAEGRNAAFARKALAERKSKISALVAGLRHEEDEVDTDRRPDTNDRASDMELHAVLESLQTVETRELAEIDAALARIASGTYGRCERCGAPVGESRLRAVPHARFCMTCASPRH